MYFDDDDYDDGYDDGSDDGDDDHYYLWSWMSIMILIINIDHNYHIYEPHHLNCVL